MTVQPSIHQTLPDEFDHPCDCCGVEYRNTELELHLGGGPAVADMFRVGVLCPPCGDLADELADDTPADGGHWWRVKGVTVDGRGWEVQCGDCGYIQITVAGRDLTTLKGRRPCNA